MLEHCHSPEDRFAGVQRIINHWLEDRQELVVAYCDISGVNRFSKDCNTSITKLKSFCQLLIDYISAGHFEVYDQLVKEAEAFNDSNIQLINKLYPLITDTTDTALNFHEKFDTEEHCEQAMGELKQELSVLGEAISRRFSLEDELIAVMHDAHASHIGHQYESAQITQH